PLAIISEKSRTTSHFFRQNFSQVTNPPIDSLRERHVMSLKTRFSNLANILEDEAQNVDVLVLDSPVLLSDDWSRLQRYFGKAVAEIDCTYPADGGPSALRAAIARIREEAEHAVRAGQTEIFLTDVAIGPDRIAIATILAAAAVHTHLVRKGLRSYASVNVRAADCLDPHYFSVLIGVGATTVNAYVAEASIADRHRRGLFGDMTLEAALARFKKAVDEGLLKVMSKMGIAVVSSYRGGCNFEAIGLSRTLVAEYFPAMPARISGIGLSGIQKKVAALHTRAWRTDVVALPVGGFYRFRRSGERHAFAGPEIHMLQEAVAKDAYGLYKKYSEAVRSGPALNLRDLLDFDR